nr:hypothetical protein [Tanacetum cinerariifolium]
MQTGSFSKLSRDQTSNPTSSTNPTLKGRIRRSSKQKVENSNFEEHLPPVAAMADNRTMAEMLRAPTEGCAEGIMVPPILAEQFELKHSLINMMTSEQFFGLEKDNPHDHIRAARRWLEKEPLHSITTWDDLVSKFINEFFPPHEPRTSVMKSRIFSKNSMNLFMRLGKDIKISFVMKAMQNQIDMVKNELRNKMKTSIQTSLSNQTNEIKNMMASLLQMNTASTSGSGSLPGNTVANPKGELKAITTRSEEDERVEETYTDPDLAEYTIKVPPPLVQKHKPPSQRNFVVHTRDSPLLNIMYPSRMLKQKQQKKDEIQIQNFWHMFKQLHLNITLAEALVLMPKYHKMLKALFSNKEKLQELANTPLNENYSAVILKKLPEKLRDPRKFLIPCGFSELKCKALADLEASINLMLLSVWKMLGLPDLILTRMTLELANRAICTPDGIARDVFVAVGKFTFPADFVVVDYESDPRVPFILGRPFLRTARALIDVHDKEMIIRNGDERLTLNIKHDTTSYSNHLHRESVNLINIFNVLSEDCLEVSVSNSTSGNPTFLLHKEITSPGVTHEIHDSEGCHFLSEELPDIDSFNDIHSHFDDNPIKWHPLSGSTTYSSNSLLEEFTDELARITYPSDYDDNLLFDIESDLREIEFLLYQGKDSGLKDLIDQTDLANLDDYFVDPTPETFTDEHAPDYSFPSRFDVYDDDFLEVKSDADNFYDEYDSFNSQDFSRDDDLPSPNNEDKVFNSEILIQEKYVKIITRVAQEKKLAICKASLLFENFDTPFYEPLVFKDVPKSMRLLLFSSENVEKVFKQGIYTSEKVHFCFLPELSHPGYHVFKLNHIFISLIRIFHVQCGKNTLLFGCSSVPFLSLLIHSSMGEFGPAHQPKTSASWEATHAYQYFRFFFLVEVKSNTENGYDDPFYSNGEKIKESKLLIDELDLPCDFPPSEYDSFISQDFSRVDAKPSTNNEDKVFNPGILSQEKPFEIINRVVQDKKLATSNASLVLEDSDPSFYEPLFFKEVPRSNMLLPFSSENEKKVFKPGIHTFEKVHFLVFQNYLIKAIKFSKSTKFLKARSRFFFSPVERTPTSWLFLVFTFTPLISSSMEELSQAK